MCRHYAQARYLLYAMAAGRPTKFRVQPGEAALLITMAPQTDHRGTNPQRMATSLLALPAARQQHDLRRAGPRMRQYAATYDRASVAEAPID